MNSTITTRRARRPTTLRREPRTRPPHPGHAPPALGLGRRRGRPGRHRLDRRLDAGRRRLRPGRRGRPGRDRGRLADQTSAILTFHTATLVSMALLVVFAAGLRRRLAGQLPSRSLLPDVAAAGLGLVAVAQLMGSGLTTEFVFGVTDPDASSSPRPLSSSATGSAPSRGCGSVPASPASPWPSPPCGTAPPRAGSAGSARSSAASPCPGALAPAVHGRDDGADLAAAHGDRPRAGRPRASCLTSLDRDPRNGSGPATRRVAPL